MRKILLSIFLLFASICFAEEFKYNSFTNNLDIANDKAEEIKVTDVAGYFGDTASPPTVESALQEIGASRAVVVSDVAYGASWNGVTLYAPSKNAVYDKIETVTGDVTGVGDCTDGACLDGTSDGGTWIKFYDAQGAGQLITGNLTGVQTWTLPDATGTVAVSATTPVTLSAAGDIGLTVAKDIVTTTPLTGGEDNVLPGADADLTLAITVAKDIVAGVGLSGGEDNVLPGADADTTLTLDLTEVNSLTWGSGTFTTMTFDAGVTDPVITASSGDLTISTGTFTLLNTGLHLLDSNASHDLIIKPGSDILADRTLTLTTGDADRTVTINADSTISGTNTGDNTVATTGDAAVDFFGAGVTAVTDATACTDIEGTGLTITAGTLNVDDSYLLNSGDIGTGVYDFGGATSVEIPNGAPTVDTAGEIGIDTTDDQLLYYGGALRVIPYTYEKCFTVFAPVAGDDNIPIWSPVDAVTVTGLYCRTQGGTSAGITISDGTNAMEEIVCDADAQADDGTLVNNTFTANERVEFDTGTVTGTVDFCNFCIRYTVDRQ